MKSNNGVIVMIIILDKDRVGCIMMGGILDGPYVSTHRGMESD